MDTDKYRSKKSKAFVTVESDCEKLSCDNGEFCKRDGGFVLSFTAGDSKYVLTCVGAPVLCVTGLISYTINFENGGVVTLDTPFGKTDFTAEPTSCDVKVSDGKAEIYLSYALSANAERIERAVKITAMIEGLS